MSMGESVTQPVSVAVLAGGKSKRLGTDKALVRLAPDDSTLLELVLDRVRLLSDDVFVVATDRPAYAAFGVPVHPDLYPDAGVLGGIGSALRHARHQACLIVSCDHPFLNPGLLRALVSAPGECDVLVPTLPGESRQGGKMVRQTLHAVYGRGCLAPIERALAEGRLQIVGFFDDVKVTEVPEAVLKAYDPDLRSFFSVNTPEALEIAKQWRSEERSDVRQSR
jgi:molybdopterin-guanine dinucleotide biosynthesis protein A